MMLHAENWYIICFNCAGGCDVNKPEIRFLVSTLIDPSPRSSMPPHERVSILSRLLESYPSLLAADGLAEMKRQR
jgi:hypothetical protein